MRRRHGRRPHRSGWCGGIDRDHACRLVVQHCTQGGPAGVENDPVEPGLGPDIRSRLFRRAPGACRHVPYLQVLDRDGVRSLGDPARDLVVPVAPGHGDAPCRPGETPTGAVTATACAPATRNHALIPAFPGLEAARVRGEEQPSVARRDLAGVHVDADRGPVILRLRDRERVADHGRPAPGLALQHRRNRTGVRIPPRRRIVIQPKSGRRSLPASTLTPQQTEMLSNRLGHASAGSRASARPLPGGRLRPPASGCRAGWRPARPPSPGSPGGTPSGS